MVIKELTESERKQVNELDYKYNISVCETRYKSGVYGVNWPGKGTKTTSETRQFINQLLKAVKLAKKINARMRN